MQNGFLVNLAVLFDRPTGISTYTHNLFPSLQTLDPTLLTASPIPDYRCYPIPNNLSPAHGSKGHLRRLLWTQFQLPHVYRTLRSRLLFSPVPEAPLFSSCRFVVMVHDIIPLRFPDLFARSPLRYYFRYYIPQVLRQTQHIVCNSEATASDIVEFWGIPAAKITPIPLACDRAHFRPLELPQRPDPPYFLYLGRPDPYKNLRRTLAAFAAIAQGNNWEFLVAGAADPRYTPALRSQVQELGLGDRVRFLEYVPYAQLPTLLNGAIALVFPTLWEGFGIPVLEAMACGTPVITSNCSALPEVAGDAGILVDPYNCGEIAAAMKAVASDSELRSRLSTLGLQRADQLSWEKTGRRTADVLAQFL